MLTPMLKHYAVSYTINYQHRVMVGIQAADEAAALAQAQSLFDQGLIWDDNDETPLLFDDFEELDGETLVFTAQEIDAWPSPDASVLALREAKAARLACEVLLTGDTETALRLARQALAK